MDEKIVWKKTLSILSRRAQSEARLRQKLQVFGADESQIDSVVSKAQKLGFLNDLEYARILARRETRLGRGARRIENVLWRWGIRPEVTQEAFLLEGIALNDRSDLAAAQHTLKKRFKSLDSTNIPKAFAYLLRQGFSVEISRKAVGYNAHNDDE